MSVLAHGSNSGKGALDSGSYQSTREDAVRLGFRMLGGQHGRSGQLPWGHLAPGWAGHHRKADLKARFPHGTFPERYFFLHLIYVFYTPDFLEFLPRTPDL